MARLGDEDEVGRGASVAQLSDAVRRRSERASRPDHDDDVPVPDPSAGIELITNVRADDQEDDVDVLADDVLDRALARRQDSPDAVVGGLPTREALEGEAPNDRADPGRDAQQAVREVLEHHHERQNPRERSTVTPRGSADLAPPLRKTASPREPRSRLKATRTTPPRWVAGILAAVATVVVIVAVVRAEASSSTAQRHGTPAAAQASTQSVTGQTSLVALDVTHVSAAIGAEGRTAASAHMAKEARARARAAERARAARARRRRQAALRTHASSTAGSTAAASTVDTTTAPVYTTPASSARSSSTGSSSDSGGGSRSSSAPAGPTGIGSAGGNCDPKCS
jgi:uncharacterized membrane protein YgcG